MNQHLQNLKGIFGGVVTAASVIVANLPEIESLLRICVSIVGIIAAVYTWRFYHHRTRILLNQEAAKKPNQNHERTHQTE